ncbi:MAG TPA: multiheme c-type cytochrome, partial [Polyangiaceae bacterium]|nr:multiheme c-type cytochrome [Polyangiaceae bacterium]
MLEALGIVACVLTASLVWLRSWWGPGRALGAFAIVAAAALAVALAPRARSAPAGAPGERPRQGYVSSNVCQSCHPSEYASWHRSYHRTMTQVASSKSVLAPFDGTHLEVDGRSIDLEQRGEEFWARLPDPDLVADAARAGSNEPSAAAPLVRRRVLMTTGSHHYQVYWVGGRRGNELRLLPAVYLLAERRWVPRKDAFLQPSGAHAQTVRWNSNCVQCHSVAGRPQHDEASDQFATEAVELGIACESCHGPGQAHVQKQHNPAQRYLTRWSGGNDETIVNPLRLDQARASQICGQCHAYFVPRDENSWWRAGFAETYRAGESLERSRLLLEPSRAEWRAAVEADPDSIFWPDGTIRIGGREYNGMVRSACYERGHGPKKLSCLSCHSMHQSEPDDQLSEAGSSDAACSKCHAELSRQGSAHTHHAADSTGSRCIGCHMPFTSYALFKGIRSHRVDSPSVNRELAAPRPNACNLCHTDRSLGWSAGYLTRWYGQPVPVLNDRERDFS